MAKITQDVGNQERLVQDVTATQQNVLPQSSDEMQNAQDFNRLLDLFPSIANVVDTTIKLETQKEQIKQQKDAEIQRQSRIAQQAGIPVDQIANPEAKKYVDYANKIESASTQFRKDIANGNYDELDEEALKSVWMQDIGNALITESKASEANDLVFIQLEMANAFKQNSDMHTTRVASKKSQETQSTAKGNIHNLTSKFLKGYQEAKDLKVKSGQEWTEEDKKQWAQKASDLIINMPKEINGILQTNYSATDINNFQVEALKALKGDGLDISVLIEGAKAPYETGVYGDQDNKEIKNKNSFYNANALVLNSLKNENEAELTIQEKKHLIEIKRQLDKKIESRSATEAENDQAYALGAFSETVWKTNTAKIRNNNDYLNDLSNETLALSKTIANGDQEEIEKGIANLSMLENSELALETADKTLSLYMGPDAADRIQEGNLTPEEADLYAQMNNSIGFTIPYYESLKSVNGPADSRYQELMRVYDNLAVSGREKILKLPENLRTFLEVDNVMIDENYSLEERTEVWNKWKDPETKRTYLSTEKESEVDNLAIDAYSKDWNPVGFFDDKEAQKFWLTDPNTYDVSRVTNEVASLAKIILLSNPGMGSEKAVKIARKMREDNIFYQNVGFKKNNLLLTEPQFNGSDIQKSANDYTDWIKTEFKKELKKQNVDKVYLEMDDKFHINGLYHIVDQDGNNISKYKLPGVTSTVNGQFLTETYNEKAMERQQQMINSSNYYKDVIGRAVESGLKDKAKELGRELTEEEEMEVRVGVADKYPNVLSSMANILTLPGYKLKNFIDSKKKKVDNVIEEKALSQDIADNILSIDELKAILREGTVKEEPQPSIIEDIDHLDDLLK